MCYFFYSFVSIFIFYGQCNLYRSISSGFIAYLWGQNQNASLHKIDILIIRVVWYSTQMMDDNKKKNNSPTLVYAHPTVFAWGMTSNYCRTEQSCFLLWEWVCLFIVANVPKFKQNVMRCLIYILMEIELEQM